MRHEYWRIGADDLAALDAVIGEPPLTSKDLQDLAAALKCQRAIDTRIRLELAGIDHQLKALALKMSETLNGGRRLAKLELKTFQMAVLL
jgi:hypothetical protein